MNLSKCRMRALYCSKQDIVYSEERVKEFIKELKQHIEIALTSKRAKYICEVINMAAGDKLI